MNGNLKMQAQANQVKLNEADSVQTLITGKEKGTFIRTVTIKATGSTLQGLVRFLIKNKAGEQMLLKEVRIPAMEDCASNTLFSKVVGWPLVNYRLPANYSLCVDLSSPNPLIVSADGFDWNYGTNDGTMQNTAVNGMAKVETANPSVDGGGAMAPIIQGTGEGVLIKSLTIKALKATSQGVVRIFMSKGGSPVSAPQLLKEVRIPATNPGEAVATFSNIVGLPVSNFRLPPGYILFGSTEKADEFNLVAEGLSWSYPSE